MQAVCRIFAEDRGGHSSIFEDRAGHAVMSLHARLFWPLHEAPRRVRTYGITTGVCLIALIRWDDQDASAFAPFLIPSPESAPIDTCPGPIITLPPMPRVASKFPARGSGLGCRNQARPLDRG